MNISIFSWKAALVLQMLCCRVNGGVLECDGHVKIEPSSVFLMGSNISIICTSTHACQRGTLHLYLNDTEVQLDKEYQSRVQIQLKNVREKYRVTCFIKCAGEPMERLVCGNSISPGYPPESPTNLMCFFCEQSHSMMCAWEAARDTIIDTKSTVHLTNLQTQEESVFHSNDNFTIWINKSQEGIQYSLWVETKNDLGSARSTLLNISLDDIVVPAPPAIVKVEILNTFTSKLFIEGKNREAHKKLYCEVKYKPTGNITWTLVSRDNTEPRVTNSLHVYQQLDADTKYEFQARCGYVSDSRYWSTWSGSFNVTTPEAEPSESLETWRSFGQIYANGTQEVTLLIKPLDPKVARGRVLGYTAFYGEQEEKKIIKICKTLELKCKTLVPPSVHTIYVTAYNSKGHSKPAPVILNEEQSDSGDCPPPRNMILFSSDHDGILVTWGAPEPDFLWYIIEWIPIRCNKQQQDLLWKRIPSENSSVYIKENIRAGIQVNISLYAVYTNGVSVPCKDVGFATELNAHPSARMKQFGKLNPQSFYTAYMTASTAAGEGPAGNIVGFKVGLKNNNENFIIILLTTSFGAILLTIFLLILVSRKKIRESMKTVLMSWIPIWLHENVPKAENSAAIKSIQKKSESIKSSSLLPPSDYEPTVTEIQETLLQEDLVFVENQNKYKEELSYSLGGPQNALLLDVSSTPLLPRVDGYKPQISNESTFESSLPQGSLQAFQENVMELDNTTSPLFLSWTEMVVDVNNVTKDNRGDESVNIFSCIRIEHDESIDFGRKTDLVCGLIQDETPLSNGIGWSLMIGGTETPDSKPYFPQIFPKQLH
ncbi:interleukin-12 receptor subunit beta-2-like isoform X2 [Lissotriton helveticus]